MSGRQRRTTLPKNTKFNEVLILVLAAVLAGISIYSAYEPESALGLVDRAVFAQTPVFITPVHTAVFEDEQFLDLDIPLAPVAGGEQVGGNWFDPSNPPAVLDARAINTRIGEEVLLTWDRPEGVDAVTVTRNFKGASSRTEQTILEKSDVLTYVDTSLQNDEEYEYKFYSVVYFENNTYVADEAAIAYTSALDEIAPAAPTNVIVTNAEYDTQYTTKQGLLITWENPADEDLQQINLYRSDSWGSRGKLIETFRIDVDTTAEMVDEYLDKTVDAHETYYYTVVAVDVAGNESTLDFDLPPVGNNKPFEPFDTPAEEGAEESAEEGENSEESQQSQEQETQEQVQDEETQQNTNSNSNTNSGNTNQNSDS